MGAALALSLTAIAAPAASARSNPGARNSHRPIANTGLRSESVSCGAYRSASVPPTVVRVVVPGDGFDWGDAGIGAAGGLGLSMLGVGGAIAVSQRRTRRTHEVTTSTR